MLTGKEALTRIDTAIEAARSDAREVGGRLEKATQAEFILREEARVCFADLARFRINKAVRDKVTNALEDAGRTVHSLLELREQAREALESEITAHENAMAGFHQRRANAADRLEDISAELDDAEAAVQLGLDADNAYVAQLKTAELAQKIASEAETKRELTQEDRKEKGAPYEADPLFMYLWSKGYGTAEYKSSGLIRALDNWVARLVRFEGARRNYFMLLEIPKRLKEHGEVMRARADAELETLVALEETARGASEAPALEGRHKSRREDIDAIDADIVRLDAVSQSLNERRATFLGGRDEHFMRAIESVSGELEDDSYARLKRAAYLTPEPEDEEIVARLLRIDDDSDDVAELKTQLSETQTKSDARVHELLELKAEFRRKRYDDYTSEFGDSDLFGTLLREFVRGAVSGAVYWDQLGRTHRRRARKSKPEFGSAKFRFPGPTTFPGSRSGGSSGGFSSGGGFGGSSSGGGFRTGGGF